MLSCKYYFLLSVILASPLTNAFTINNDYTGTSGGYVPSSSPDVLVTATGRFFMEQFTGSNKRVVDVSSNATIGSSIIWGNIDNHGLITFSDNFLDGTISEAVFTTNNFINYSTGIIDLTRDNPFGKYHSPVGDTITITGNYDAQGGAIKLNTLFANSTGNGGVGFSDKLIVNGNVTATTNASTQLIIVPVYYSGRIDSTQGDGIEVIHVGGNSADNAFVLSNPLTAGAFEYGLGRGLTAATSQSWYLRTIGINPTVGAYLGAQTAATQMFSHSLTDRQSAIASSHDTNLWLRVQGTRSDYRSVHKLIDNRTHTYMAQLGSDILTLHNGPSALHLGVMAGYGDYENKTRSRTGSRLKAKAETTGYNVGIYATWYADSESQTGAYVDAWSQMGWFRNKVNAKSKQQHKKYNSHVWSNSVELGYGLAFVKGRTYQWLVTPQAQFTYNYYGASNFHDQTTVVTNNKASGLETRLGTKLQAKGIHTNRLIQPYVELNWINTTAKNQLDFNKITLKDGLPKNRGEAKIGLEGGITNNLNISTALGGQWGRNNFSQYQGEINMSYKW